jgi:alpha-D-ribose 1-methylphosphonate 5-triphosphate synthase subunit PhnL
MTKVEKIKTRLGLIDRLHDLAPMDQSNGEEQVKSRSMN